MFHGVFMSSMYGKNIDSYRHWHQFDSCDSFIFIASDDYYFYNHLGFKNAIFIPNIYTFEPSEVKNSNLTNHNIVILGRLNDFIKGVKYAVEAMQYIVKEVPDAKLSLFSSDSRVQFPGRGLQAGRPGTASYFQQRCAQRNLRHPDPHSRRSDRKRAELRAQLHPRLYLFPGFHFHVTVKRQNTSSKKTVKENSKEEPRYKCGALNLRRIPWQQQMKKRL